MCVGDNLLLFLVIGYLYWPSNCDVGSFQCMGKTLNAAMFSVLLDIDKVAYSACLKEFLQYLHCCIETWSRMGTSVHWALVDHGAFHLLLNEFHTASTTMVSSFLLKCG